MTAVDARICPKIIDATDRVVVGQRPAIRRALTCILAGGHLLIEDLPGLGKTTLAHTLATVLGLSFKRLQFTADMLPADVVGSSVFMPTQSGGESGFRFVPGPVFTQMLLADEINRAPPKVQSALLEAMEERQVSVDGKRYPLPGVFFVIATQNPLEQAGTYPLPESQLDRFAMVIRLGYPDADTERRMLLSGGGRAHLDEVSPVTDAAGLQQLRDQAGRVHVAERVVAYVQSLLAASREAPEFRVGLSPRAGLMLLNLARAWALIDQRDHVLPDDVQAVLPDLINHRVGLDGHDGRDAADLLLERVPAP
ncbi:MULTISPECIES: MoxR family ATPase [unclassified Guyparkeria]|uniref:AAA family ATPase n=1 Tax=unclassified Guyparkeria TaxID=2626246 RepID=UPI00073368A7|nr:MULTISPECIES: MoxR family ATPase [unclassified Guyparkeria]KTG15914.1 AAA family ATPase [Guyparkeria sp. XI15]OAE84664.1 AAA family ATPase [Guyparkeria sp. WRN-7]